MLSVEEETSKNFIFASRRAKAFAVDTKVYEGIKISSFFFKSKQSAATSSAPVQE